MDSKSALTWAKERAGMSKAAPSAALPPGLTEGTVRHPFPVADRAEYKKTIKGAGIPARTHDAPVEDVPLSSLTAIQRTVNSERLAQHMNDPHLIPEGKLGNGHGGLVDKPIVVKSGGKNFIHDGHHRSVAAHLKGQPSIQARVIDLDGE